MHLMRSKAPATGDYRIARNNGQWGPGKWAVLTLSGTVVATTATLKMAYAEAVRWERERSSQW